ncbi:unnamed protein product, partial [Rotaria sp. Silwood2]
MKQFMKAQQHDDYAKNIMNNIKKHKNYIFKDNLLMRRSKHPVPYVPQGDLRKTILKIYHDTAANGAHFARIWQLVAMDFHGPITPTSQRGNKYIISLTDVLSKLVITKAVRDNTTQTAVRFLKEDVISKCGTPRCILTDNGTHFTSALMNELIKQIGVTHLYSTSYHPQTNGQVERYNSTMDAKIAALSNLRKTDWDDPLPFVAFNYNASIHSSTKQIPFQMMYGRLPALPFDYRDTNITISYDSEHVKKLQQFLSKLNEQARAIIIKAQERYKQQYDPNRSEPPYNIGDLVLVKTLNFRYKFDTRYEGPF